MQTQISSLAEILSQTFTSMKKIKQILVSGWSIETIHLTFLDFLMFITAVAICVAIVGLCGA